MAYCFGLRVHTAAVKALSWCTFQEGLLASGGGTADQFIRLWDVETGECLRSIPTYSQVCAMVWNKRYRELVSSHGFSFNQICVWSFPSMKKLTELKGHTGRVLHLASSPDGYSVASAAPDCTLQFWKLFPPTIPLPIESLPSPTLPRPSSDVSSPYRNLDISNIR